MKYIQRVYDTSNRFGPGPSEQDRVDYDKWTMFLVSTLGPMNGQVTWFTHYHPQRNEDALERYNEQIYRCYGILDAQLAKTGGKSVLPKGVTTVNHHFYPWIYLYEFSNLSFDKYPNLKKWHALMSERPEVKAAYEQIEKGEKLQ